MPDNRWIWDQLLTITYLPIIICLGCNINRVCKISGNFTISYYLLFILLFTSQSSKIFSWLDVKTNYSSKIVYKLSVDINGFIYRFYLWVFLSTCSLNLHGNTDLSVQEYRLSVADIFSVIFHSLLIELTNKKLCKGYSRFLLKRFKGKYYFW